MPTIGAIAASAPADLLGVDADLAPRFEVQQIRDGRGVDRDKSRDANERECLHIKTRRGDRIRGHAFEEV